MDIEDLAALTDEAFGPAAFAAADNGDTVRLHGRGDVALLVTERAATRAEVAVRLGPAPEGEALRAILEAGCGGAGTGAGGFALDGGELVLVAALDLAAMGADDARAAIGSLLAHAAYWRREGFGAASAAAAPASDAILLRL